MSNHCIRHYEEPITAYCRTCQQPFCDRCLVYSFGPKKPPFCVGCALSASGVRNTKITAARVAAPAFTDQYAATGAPADKRLIRAQRRAAKAGAKAARKAGQGAGTVTEAAAARSDQVPAPAGLSGSGRFRPTAHQPV